MQDLGDGKNAEGTNRKDAEGINKDAGGIKGTVLATPTLGGVALALVFWWQSLTPTLIPRPWGTQAVISGVCLVVGYGIGMLVGRWAARLLARWNVVANTSTWRWAWGVVCAGWLIGVTYGLVLWLRWQNDQRELMGMAVLDWSAAVAMAPLALVTASLLIAAGRAIGYGVGAVLRVARRRLPGRLGGPAAVLTALALVVAVVGALALRGLASLADAHYASVNDETEEGIVRPQSASVSGSSESLVPWATLGRTGRTFVAEATTRDELAQFHGSAADAVDPVRVYVGVQSADSLQERADLAVRELERTGGFEREVLVVWVPTGSGWMIDQAAEALEQLYDGDTAIVGIQYSYLPSLFSVFLDSGMAVKAGTTLFNAVEARWRQLPPGDRPKLLVFGKSLGTAGAEAPFAAGDAASSIGNLVVRTDGALIVGAKYGNPIRTQLTEQRDAGSPVWQPVFDDGRTVRFVNRDPDQPALDPSWPEPRIVYLQHPSDPVPFWNVDALWRPPEWMDRPRGYDVTDAARWFPVVSAVQAVGDQLEQLSPPPGFGHDYATEYVKGWTLVAPPNGWTDDDTDRLEQFLDFGDTEEVEP